MIRAVRFGTVSGSYVRKHMTNQMCKQRLFVKSKEECHEKVSYFSVAVRVGSYHWNDGGGVQEKPGQSDAGGAGQADAGCQRRQRGNY